LYEVAQVLDVVWDFSGGVGNEEGGIGECWVALLSQPAYTSLPLKACLKRHGEFFATSKNTFKNDVMFWMLSKMPNKTRCF